MRQSSTWAAAHIVSDVSLPITCPQQTVRRTPPHPLSMAAQPYLLAQTPIELICPTTPAARVVNQPPSSGLLDAVMIGGCAPPVPKTLAEKIWSGEFVDFDMLLPANLGAPELTMRDLLANKDRPVKSNKVESFEQWIICFNTYLSVLSIKHPQRVRDMLAYASLAAKSSREYEGTPWLVYNRHFRRLATAQQQWNWS